MMTPATEPGQARPRVTGDREAEILDATLGVLCEVGYDRLTMDAVAQASRASKATLYRRWSSKGDLVVDALVRAKGAPQVVDRDLGDLREDLLAASCHDSGLTQKVTRCMVGGVVSALQHDEEFAAAFHERFLAPKLAESMAMFERARDRGELCPDVDLDLLAIVIPAVALHRSFVLGLPTDDSMIERIIDEIVMPAATREPLARAKP